MFCKHCGVENPDGASFCRVCGSALAVAPVIEAPVDPTVETPVEPTVETPVQPEAAPAAEGETAPAVTAKDPGKSMGVAALVLGIIGLVTGTICACGCACLGGMIPAVVCIVGLVLGIIAMNKSKAAGFKNTKALVGVILSGVGLASIVLFVLLNGLIGGLNGMTQEQGYGDNYFYYGY